MIQGRVILKKYVLAICFSQDPVLLSHNTGKVQHCQAVLARSTFKCVIKVAILLSLYKVMIVGNSMVSMWY